MTSKITGSACARIAVGCFYLVLAWTAVVAWNTSAEGNTAGPAGHDYYVSPRGNDRSDGSRKHPWATISRASLSVSPGDTVHVLPGTYRGRVLTSASGSNNARVTFISDEQWKAYITGDIVDNSAWDNQGNYVDIIGFDVSGSGRTGLYNDASHVRFIRNHVHDIAGPTNLRCANGGAGIMHGNYSAFDNDTIANTVHDVGWTNSALCPNSQSAVHGIYHANAGGHVTNNLVFHNRAYGIHLWHAATGVVISDNTVFNNGSSGLIVGAGGEPKGSRAMNCVVTNNIFVHNGRYGFVEGGNTGSNQYVSNLTFGNVLGSAQLQNGNVADRTINVDPLFEHYTGDSTGNYHLRRGSPALAVGSQHGAPPDDIEGQSRLRGSPVDLGAYQSTGRDN